MAAVSSFTSSGTMAVPSPVYSPIPSSVAHSHNTLFAHFQNPRPPSLTARNLAKTRKRWSSPMAVRSRGYGTLDQGGRKGVWSIRDDLILPSSPYMPMEVQNQQTPAMVPESLQGVVNQLLQHRIVRCGGEVDDEMARVVVSQLLYLDAIDPTKDIIMYVNSPGGSVTAGMAMFDTMRHVRPDVCTVCVGLAASMGAFLLSAGTKGKRFSLPSSRIMIHQPLGGAQGSQTDVNVQADEMIHHKATLNGYLALHTGQSIDKIHVDTDRDFFMSPREAKEYGLIDEVIWNPLKALFLLSTSDKEETAASVS